LKNWAGADDRSPATGETLARFPQSRVRGAPARGSRRPRLLCVWESNPLSWPFGPCRVRFAVACLNQPMRRTASVMRSGCWSGTNCRTTRGKK